MGYIRLFADIKQNRGGVYMDLMLNKRFDAKENKHFLENMHFVLHCHHYNGAIHRAIVNTPFIDGKEFIFNIVAEDFYNTLGTVIKNKNITGANNILNACSLLYSSLGFGLMDFSNLSSSGGLAVSTSSHLASGYLAKWGKQKAPVDDFGRGFIAAAWALAYGKDYKRCKVTQTKCISCEDAVCEFKLMEV